MSKLAALALFVAAVAVIPLDLMLMETSFFFYAWGVGQSILFPGIISGILFVKARRLWRNRKGNLNARPVPTT